MNTPAAVHKVKPNMAQHMSPHTAKAFISILESGLYRCRENGSRIFSDEQAELLLSLFMDVYDQIAGVKTIADEAWSGTQYRQGAK